MKIGEFAMLHRVTTKMLRHYDEVGLLKPSAIDPATGYRSYEPEQAHRLNWILILKNLEFSLAEIKELLSGPADAERIVRRLIRKRIDISSALNEQQQKKIAIDRLIAFIKEEGFRMEQQIDLLGMDAASVHEIKKNIPNMETFYESAAHIAALCSERERVAVFRFDISHFKQVNDDFGFEAGDNVIVACYRMIESSVNARLPGAAIGRAHGDEFIVFACAGKEAVASTAEAIVEAMKSCDFSSIGCPRAMACYIGGLVGPSGSRTDVRALIEESIEALDRARSLGANGVWIGEYGA